MSVIPSSKEKIVTLTLSVAGSLLAGYYLWSKCRPSLTKSASTDVSKVDDLYHNVRYRKSQSPENCTHHKGLCHCQRVQFRVRGPRVLNAVDIPSKLRFPRVSIYFEDFELLSDPSVLSMYTVQHMDGEQQLGIHSFCSFCGMQVLFAPSIDPLEVQVNLDCLDAGSIEKVHIAYHSINDTKPIYHNRDSTHQLNKRGVGYVSSPHESNNNNNTVSFGQPESTLHAHDGYTNRAHYHHASGNVDHYLPPYTESPRYEIEPPLSDTTEDIFTSQPRTSSHHHAPPAVSYSNIRTGMTEKFTSPGHNNHHDNHTHHKMHGSIYDSSDSISMHSYDDAESMRSQKQQQQHNNNNNFTLSQHNLHANHHQTMIAAAVTEQPVSYAPSQPQQQQQAMPSMTSQQHRYSFTSSISNDEDNHSLASMGMMLGVGETQHHEHSAHAYQSPHHQQQQQQPQQLPLTGNGFRNSPSTTTAATSYYQQQQMPPPQQQSPSPMISQPPMPSSVHTKRRSHHRGNSGHYPPLSPASAAARASPDHVSLDTPFYQQMKRYMHRHMDSEGNVIRRHSSGMGGNSSGLNTRSRDEFDEEDDDNGSTVTASSGHSHTSFTTPVSQVRHTR